jgi:hypothetical protein
MVIEYTVSSHPSIRVFKFSLPLWSKFKLNRHNQFKPLRYKQNRCLRTEVESQTSKRMFLDGYKKLSFKMAYLALKDNSSTQKTALDIYLLLPMTYHWMEFHTHKAPLRHREKFEGVPLD